MIGSRQGDVHALQVRGDLRGSYRDVFTPEAIEALAALAPLDAPRRALMAARIQRRARRARDRRRIAFLDPAATIPGTDIAVRDARDGKFGGSEIPADLQRQWIQGTGPATRPNAPVEKSLRNVAYALLSGADGWMFDGEDALGQVSTMSLDNQRNLKLAIAQDPVFLKVAEQVAAEMNAWARGFFGRPIIDDWRAAARLHDQDLPAARAAPRRSACPPGRRHGFLRVDRRPGALRRQQPRAARGSPAPRSSSTCRRSRPPRKRRSGIACWTALEQHLSLPAGSDQGLRARRAARGLLPVDGDPRRARAALRRLQHRPLGLHQQRLGRDGVGSRRSSIRTSTPSR